jgi:hypothetical protein
MRLFSVTLAVLLTTLSSGGESSSTVMVMAREERRGDADEDTTHGVDVDVEVQDSEEGRLDRMDLLLDDSSAHTSDEQMGDAYVGYDGVHVPPEEEVKDVDENVSATAGNYYLRASSESHEDGAEVDASLLGDDGVAVVAGAVGGGGVMNVGTAGGDDDYDFETQVLGVLAGQQHDTNKGAEDGLGGYCYNKCFSNNNCRNSACPECNNQVCTPSRPAPRPNACNTSCNNNNQCRNNRSCSYCIGGLCQFSPDGVCRTRCYNDSHCRGSSECPSCIGNTCQPNSRGSCGAGCNNDGDCEPSLGCAVCRGRICQQRITPQPTYCIGNEGALRTALQAGGAHKLCPQVIVVSSEIVSSASGVQLSCQGGGTGCTIKSTNNRNRILNLSGSSWTITGITFQNGGGVSQVRKAYLRIFVISSLLRFGNVSRVVSKLLFSSRY